MSHLELEASLLRHLLSKGAQMERVIHVYETLGLEKPNINQLNGYFLARVCDMPTKNLPAEPPDRLCPIRSARVSRRSIEAKGVR